MFDLSDHALVTISTWAEVGILIFMVWEKYGYHLFPERAGQMTREPATSPAFGVRLWENRTIIVAILGLALIAWLNLRQGGSSPPDTTQVANLQSQLTTVTRERDTARQERDQE